MTTAGESTIEPRDAITNAREAGVNPLDYMMRRGFVQDVTDEAGLRAAFAAGPVTFYQGFDPTGASLHAGHLVGIMMLATLQRFGHRPIALGGGGTAMVGDPTGKTSTRTVLSLEEIDANLEGILVQFRHHLDFEGGAFTQDPPNPAAVLINNADWLLDLKYIPFLRDIGRHFSVNEMLAAETYRNRLEHGLNFVEFNYRLVQSYDFLHLFRTQGCILQLGGSDQWGNITGGVELVRRVAGARVHAMATPLVTKADGTKYGKTEAGALWLDRSMMSPYAFHQFWLNVEDSSVVQLLKYFTFRTREEIEELDAVTADKPSLRQAQQVLADDVTAFVHGADEARRARHAAAALFGGGDLRALDGATLDAALHEAPHVEVPAGTDPPTYGDLLAESGLVASRSAARRTVAEGGAYVNNVRISQPEDRPGPDDVLAGGWLLLRRGKRSVAGVRLR